MKSKSYLVLLILINLALMAIACDGNVAVNKTLRIGDGEKHDGGLSTVNGDIYVGKNSIINGECNSVNGRIKIGDHSKIDGIGSVNGSISIGKDVVIDGEIGVYLEKGSRVKDNIETVNGKIELDGAVCERDISTINGGIELTNAAVVKGNIFIEGSHGKSDKHHRINVRLESGSVVEGDIIAEDEKTRVTVYLSGDSKVLGRIENAEIVKE